ncbi:hypothetical protein JTE90_021509 [Oedothorax gibbosus]|uniref:MHD1 domain-containing protein n=1 Tax=Oedothorax gibbosus TaxID=931172 RepID=A0AAV6VN67_9ARAC|nr:hypothetical protein JTE90_021509 [Oedothorax gibbosus]
MNADLQKGRNFYQLTFEMIEVNFGAAVYRQMSRWLIEEIKFKIGEVACQTVGDTTYYYTHQTREQINRFLSKLSGIEVFELHIVLQEFSSFKSCLSEEDQASLPVSYCHQWFEDYITEWFTIAKTKIRGRIHFAMEFDKELNTQPQGVVIDVQDEGPKPQPALTVPLKVKYSSSSVEAVQAFSQLREFWHQLLWPDKYTAYPFILLIVEATTTAAVLYSNLLWKRLRDDSNCFGEKGYFLVNKKVILYMNNLENVHYDLNQLEEAIGLDDVLQAVINKEQQIAAEMLCAKVTNPIEKAQTHVRTMIDCFVRSVAYHVS